MSATTVPLAPSSTSNQPLSSGENEPPPRPDPCLFVLFGASGDLARKDLVPSLFELSVRGLLPERFRILGSARRAWDDDTFRNRMLEAVEGHSAFDRTRWDAFAGRLHYTPVDSDEDGGESGWTRLADRVRSLRREVGLHGETLYHLAVPPSAFGEIVGQLGEAGLADRSDAHGKLVVEKPFGTDEASARALDRELRAHFPEDRIYRVDHYLGKETVQNLLVTRFANPGFEPVWNRNYIDHVQITAAESEGIGTRGSFYDATGVVRDMLQNHLLQLLCFAAASPPVRCVGGALRDETVRALRSVRAPDPEQDLVLGQYRAGRRDGDSASGYTDEDGVDADSDTPTFAALRVYLDTWRWAGVPFYLRTGKRLARKATEVAVHFKPTPQAMFPHQEPFRSVLTFRLQPDEAVVQTIAAKRPGPTLTLQPVRMHFSYADAFGLESPPRAYAWLLHDALLGDPTLFARSDWIYRAWSLIDPLVEWADAHPPEGYESGSWGPERAADLIERDGRAWSVR